MYYKELTTEKDKKIEQLNNELSKMKEYIQIFENNNTGGINSSRLPVPVVINTPKSINQNSFISNSGFNLDLGSRLKFDKEKYSTGEIYSERLITGGGGGGVVNSISINQNKKLNVTSSSFLTKSNQGSVSIKNTKSFFGSTSQALYDNPKSNYFGMGNKSSERKNSNKNTLNSNFF
jgi:hypothetical protein